MSGLCRRQSAASRWAVGRLRGTHADRRRESFQRGLGSNQTRYRPMLRSEHDSGKAIPQWTTHRHAPAATMSVVPGAAVRFPFPEMSDAAPRPRTREALRRRRCTGTFRRTAEASYGCRSERRRREIRLRRRSPTRNAGLRPHRAAAVRLAAPNFPCGSSFPPARTTSLVGRLGS